MKATKYLITILLFLSTNIVCGQVWLDAKLDSIEMFVNSESFDENYKSVVEYLKTIKSDCLASNSRLTKIRFLNCYGAALYFTQDYAGCIPVLKNYIKCIEDNQVNDMSSEENLSVYEALGRSQFLIGEIDEAYTTTRRALLYFEAVLDKYATGYQLYNLLSQICEARRDTVMLDEVHHAAQLCFIEYWNNSDSSFQAKDVKAAYEKYTEMISLQTEDYYKYREIRANLLKNIALYIEAEYEYNKLIKDIESHSFGKRDIVQDTYLGLFQLYKTTNALEKAKHNIPIVRSYFKEYDDKESLNMYAYILNQYAMLLDNSGVDNFSEASNVYGEALDICRVDSIRYILKNNYASLLNHKGVDSILKNDTKDARSHLEKAILLCTNDVLLGSIKHNIGRIEMLDGNYAKALKLLRESADIQLRTKGEIAERTKMYINECNSRL